MGESIYQAFLVSVVRAALLVAGGWLVSRGLADESLMREVATGLALIAVTQAWSFWRIYRRQLFTKWLLLLGLQETPSADPDGIVAEAKQRVREGWLP